MKGNYCCIRRISILLVLLSLALAACNSAPASTTATEIAQVVAAPTIVPTNTSTPTPLPTSTPVDIHTPMPTDTPTPTDTPVPTNTLKPQFAAETPTQAFNLSIEPWVVSECEQQRCCFDFQNNEGDPPEGTTYAIEFTPVNDEAGVNAIVLHGTWNTYGQEFGDQYITLYPDNLALLPVGVYHWTIVLVDQTTRKLIGRGLPLTDTFEIK